MVKLSPNVTYIDEFAYVAVKAGADAISAINTIQALEIEPYTQKPVLGNLVGGMSGRAILPIAQRKIADIVLRLEEEKRKGNIKKVVPIVGVGGIHSGLDAVRFILLGCTAVQVGTAVKDDIFVFKKIAKEIEDYMKEMNYTSLDEFRGAALKWIKEHQEQRKEE